MYCSSVLHYYQIKLNNSAYAIAVITITSDDRLEVKLSLPDEMVHQYWNCCVITLMLVFFPTIRQLFS